MGILLIILLVLALVAMCVFGLTAIEHLEIRARRRAAARADDEA